MEALIRRSRGEEKPFGAVLGCPDLCGTRMASRFADRLRIRFKDQILNQPRPNRLDDLSSALPRAPISTSKPRRICGWRTWRRDSFESNNGRSGTGSSRTAGCAARSGSRKASQRHGQRSWRLLHDVRGLLPVCDRRTGAAGAAVTVSFACEFLDAAREGERIDCDGEIMRAAGR